MHRVPQKLVNTDISYVIFLNMFFLIHIFQNKNSSKNWLEKSLKIAWKTTCTVEKWAVMKWKSH